MTNEVLVAMLGSGTNAYGYDSVGNRLTRTVTGFASPSVAPTNQSFNFDQSERMDNDGNPATANRTPLFALACSGRRPDELYRNGQRHDADKPLDV